MIAQAAMRRTGVSLFGVWLLAVFAAQGASAQGGRGQGSPAAQRPPQSTTPQQYPREQIESGRVRFASQCGFCHGRDAAGGESGPDLTRSPLVAADVRGDRIGPVVRSGRIDKGMPAFALSDADLTAIVAFVHDQKTQADAASGGRRAVDVADLQSGDASAGKKYFDGACAKCHSASGDLAGLAGRLRGLPLLQRMLNPAGGRGAGPRGVPTVTVTAGNGQTVTGKLAYRDEFTIALTDASGWYRSWPIDTVKLTVDDPLQAHVDQLGKYTDADMHNVLAYLHTLR
ncbi:MAG TPA: c-type cytochrome [Vicinamibacterales bacterium]|jgi:cytochrome c oxidase cbb3-type subunit 3